MAIRRTLPLAFGATLAVLATVSSAHAQSTATVPGYGINRFDPSERGSQWFTLESLDWQGKFRPAAGVVGDFGYLPMQLHDVNNKDQAVVESQLAFHLGGTVTLYDIFRVGLSLPVYAEQSGTTIQRFDGTYKGASGGGLGDLRIGADVRIFGKPKEVFRFGAGVRLWVPTGDRNNYLGDDHVALQPHLDVAGDYGQFAYGVRAGYLYRGLKETFGPTPIGDEIPFGASIGMKLLDEKLLVGPEVQGSVAVSDTGTVLASKNSVPVYYLLGARYSYNDFRIGAAAGPGGSSASGTAAFRALLSFEWAPTEAAAPPPPPPPADRDKDGIVDEKDACPDVPGVANDDPKKNGCPSDRDGDGIVDTQDNCSNVPGVASEDPKRHGCPPDKDGDGIPDAEDACPNVPGIASTDPAKHGCPPDRDGDGIGDDVDACPDLKGVASTDPKKHGCPPDTDGDGVADAEDACPNDPGPRSEDPKKNGCPAVVVQNGQIMIMEQVKFKTNSAEILKESDGILDAVAKTLTEHAEIKRVRVEGHTDNVGNAAANKDLSRRRAASVVAALVKRKLDAKRFESKGLGQEKPVDSNDTDAGKQNNRRVEFHIVDTNAAATDAAPATPKTGATTPAPKTGTPAPKTGTPAPKTGTPAPKTPKK